MIPKIGEYKIAYDGVYLAEHFIVRGVDMPFIPPITINELEIDGKAGAWSTGRNIGTRDIVVRLAILKPTREMENALNAWVTRSKIVSKDHPCKLELGEGFYVNAMMTGSTDIIHDKQDWKWSKADVTFHCSDPIVYRYTHEQAIVSGENKIRILGNEPALPVFTINKPSATLDVIDESTQKFVRIKDLNSAQTVVLDMAQHKATVNGTYRAIDPSVTTWWGLNPGEQIINVKSGSGTMIYTEAYL